jgi:hypothetical protein
VVALHEKEMGATAATHPDASRIEAESIAAAAVRTALLLEVEKLQSAQIRGAVARRTVRRSAGNGDFTARAAAVTVVVAAIVTGSVTVAMPIVTCVSAAQRGGAQQGEGAQHDRSQVHGGLLRMYPTMPVWRRCHELLLNCCELSRCPDVPRQDSSRLPRATRGC